MLKGDQRKPGFDRRPLVQGGALTTRKSIKVNEQREFFEVVEFIRAKGRPVPGLAEGTTASGIPSTIAGPIRRARPTLRDWKKTLGAVRPTFQRQNARLRSGRAT